MYHQWRVQRNEIQGIEFISADLDSVKTLNTENLVFQLSCFICEIHKLDNTEFPQKTVYDIIIMIQFHLEKLGLNYKLLEGEVFLKLHQVVDNIMKQCSVKGLGCNVKKTQILDDQKIEQLWSAGVLGGDTPRKLQDTVLFLLGYHCALWAQREHYNLCRPSFDSQFSLEFDGSMEYLKFCEDHSTKTNQGGFKNHKTPGRVVCVYPAENEDRCPVCYFKEYVSKLPLTEKCANLYLVVSIVKQFRNGQWYHDSPIGINNIGTHIKMICKEAGLMDFFTNHSLHVSNVTNLYNSGVPEQIIQENTSHRSNEALRGYKVMSIDQKKHASKILSTQSVKQNEANKENVQKVQLEICLNVKN